MMAKDPADRWPSLAEARQRLDELAEGRRSGAHEATPSVTSAGTRRTVTIGAVVVVLLLAVFAAWAAGFVGRYP